MTSQWPDNLWHDHVIDDIELVRYRFFHGNIHSRLCKKWMNCNHWCVDCYEWGGKRTFKVLCHECIYSDWLVSSKAHTPGLSTCATKLCQGLSNIYNHFFSNENAGVLSPVTKKCAPALTALLLVHVKILYGYHIYWICIIAYQTEHKDWILWRQFILRWSPDVFYQIDSMAP